MSTQRDDAVLLFSDRAAARSPFTKNMGVQPQSEDLILIGTADSNRPVAGIWRLCTAASNDLMQALVYCAR